MIRRPIADPVLSDSVAELYYDLHRHPELSMREYRTAARVEAELAGCGVIVRRRTQTGLEVVIVNGEGPGVAMRADLDALPLREQTALPYASTGPWSESAPGPAMHACGHDLHTACLVGVIRYLCSNRDTWRGTFIGVFQPGEETGEGALAMINDGLFAETGVPDIMLSQHVSAAPLGTAICLPGPFLSRQRSWAVTVTGVGGHAARPHLTSDPVVAAAAMILRLQTVVSREIDPFRMAVVTVGSIHGGTKENIIPADVEFTVSTRSHDARVSEIIDSSIRRILDAEAAASGVAVHIRDLADVPACFNDEAAARRIVPVLTEVFGSGLRDDGDPLPASDDFGQYRAVLGVPSVMWNFGCQDPALYADDLPSPPRNHDPRFAPMLPQAARAGLDGALAVVCAELGSP